MNNIFLLLTNKNSILSKQKSIEKNLDKLKLAKPTPVPMPPTDKTFKYKPELADELGPDWKKVRNRVYWISEDNWNPYPADTYTINGKKRVSDGGNYYQCDLLSCEDKITQILKEIKNIKGIHAFSIATSDSFDIRMALYGDKKNKFNISLIGESKENLEKKNKFSNLMGDYDVEMNPITGPELCQPWCTEKCCPTADYNPSFFRGGPGNSSCFTPDNQDNNNKHASPKKGGGQDPHPKIHPCIDYRFSPCNKKMNNYNCFKPGYGQTFYYNSKLLPNFNLYPWDKIKPAP